MKGKYFCKRVHYKVLEKELNAFHDTDWEIQFIIPCEFAGEIVCEYLIIAKG